MARIVYNSNDEFYAQCEHCGRQIAYYEDEVEDGAIVCPNCEEDIYVDPTKKPFVWPGGFYHFSASDGATCVMDREIQAEVDGMLKNLQKSAIGHHTAWATGDTLIIGIRYEDGIQVYVTKDYYNQFLDM